MVCDVNSPDQEIGFLTSQNSDFWFQFQNLIVIVVDIIKFLLGDIEIKFGVCQSKNLNYFNISRAEFAEAMVQEYSGRPIDILLLRR